MTASRHVPALLWTGVIYAVLGLLLTAVCAGQEEASWLVPIPLPGSLSTVGSALLIGAAGLLSSALVAAARERSLEVPARAIAPAEPSGGTHAAVLQFLGRAETTLPAAELRPSAPPMARLTQVVATVLPAILALLGALPGLRLAAASSALGPVSPDAELATGIALVVAAFPVLVSERVYAHLSEAAHPEAPQIERLGARQHRRAGRYGKA